MKFCLIEIFIIISSFFPCGELGGRVVEVFTQLITNLKLVRIK